MILVFILKNFGIMILAVLLGACNYKIYHNFLSRIVWLHSTFITLVKAGMTS